MLGRILRVGEPGLLFFIRRPMGGDNEELFFGAIHILRYHTFRHFLLWERIYINDVQIFGVVKQNRIKMDKGGR